MPEGCSFDAIAARPRVARRRACLCYAVTSALLLATAAPACALDVVRVEWGYDGSVRLGSFNPVTITLGNSTAEPFDGVLQLERAVGPNRAGMPIIERIYVSPGARRRVRFYPRLNDFYGNWRLRWGTFDSFDLPPLVIGEAAKVFVVDEAEAPVPRGFARLEASDFPASVVCMASIGHLAIDRQIDLDREQWQALVDWVHAGGKLYLLCDETGAHPLFPAPHGDLNERAERTHFGAGKLFRIAQTGRQFSESSLDRLPSTGDSMTDGSRARGSRVSLDQQVAPALAWTVIPQHSWPWIIVLALAFLLLVSPVAWFLWRRTNSWWLPQVYLVGLSTVFSVLFLIVGQRGYGESERVTAVTYARPLGDGRFAVTQWINIFVTLGKSLQIQHGSLNGVDLYGNPQVDTALPGSIVNHTPGGLVTQAPLFSWRDLVHAGVCRGPEVLSAPTGGTSAGVLDFRLAPGHPAVRRAWAIRGESAYSLQVLGDHLRLDPGRAHPLTTFLSSTRTHFPYYTYPRLEVGAADLETLMWLGPTIIEDTLWNMTDWVDRNTGLENPVVGPANTLEVFVLTDRPASFASRAPLPSEVGMVIYHYTFAEGPP
ncbi:MAG: hypothetical protein AB7O52_07470 [Planctomycetota bacterium]